MQDLEGHKQMAIVIRYVDDELTPHESFIIGFLQTDKCYAGWLINLYKTELNLLRLEMKD